MNKTLLATGIFFVTFFFLAHCQTYTVKDFRGELNISIAGKYEKKMEKVIEELNQADELERKSISVIEEIEQRDTLSKYESEYKSAISDLHKVSVMYQESFDQMFEVFAENCELARARMKEMHHYSSGLLKAKYYEIRSQKGMDRADNIREIVELADKPGWMQYKMSEALELEKLAIRDKGRALNIMQDFPVEYDYGWENDVTPEEVEAALGDPAINRPPDDLFVQKPVEKKDTVVSEEVVNPEAVIFSVQIAAHTSPLPDEYIRKFYQGNLEVKEKIEGGWYKYTIGEFYSFNEVNNLLAKCNVERAFIVAYQNDKKLTIKEALTLIRDNQ